MNKELELINRKIEQLKREQQKKCEEVNKRVEEAKHSISILEARKQKAIDNTDIDEYNSVFEQLKKEESTLKMFELFDDRGSSYIDDAQYNLLCDQINHALDEEWNRTAAKIIAALAQMSEAADEYTDNVTHGNEMLHTLQYDLRGRAYNPFEKDNEYIPRGRYTLNEMVENVVNSTAMTGLREMLKK